MEKNITSNLINMLCFLSIKIGIKIWNNSKDEWRNYSFDFAKHVGLAFFSDSDSVIFNDRLAQGGDFVVEWDRHFNNGEDNRLKMQLRLFLDGSLTFVYQKFHQSVIESISSKKYKVLIGLKDGFSEPVPESKTQG